MLKPTIAPAKLPAASTCAVSVTFTPTVTGPANELLTVTDNSGNAGTPHLHLGFLSSIDPITTRPVAFVGYEVRAPDADVWHAPTGALRPGDILRPLTW